MPKVSTKFLGVFAREMGNVFQTEFSETKTENKDRRKDWRVFLESVCHSSSMICKDSTKIRQRFDKDKNKVRFI